MLVLPFATIWLRSVIYSISGIEARADRISINAARYALATLSISDARQRLSKEFNTDLPLAIDLVTSSEDKKLAYQILYCSSSLTRNAGLRAAVADTLRKIDVNWEPELINPAPSLTYGHISAAIIIYLIWCALYVVIAPLPYRKIEEYGHALFERFEWVHFFDTAGVSVAQGTASFVLPLALGIHLYEQRKINYAGRENFFQRCVLIVAVQFVLSFIVNVSFAIFAIANRYDRPAETLFDGLISLWDGKVWVDVITNSLVPGVALVVWAGCKARLRIEQVAMLAVAVVASISFFLSRYAYECAYFAQCSQDDASCLARAWRGFYGHQMVLGAFLVFGYYLAALAAETSDTRRSAFSVIRSLRDRRRIGTVETSQEPGSMKILFLAANPSQLSHNDLEEELRSIETELRGVKFRDSITLIAEHAIRPDDLLRHVRANRPNVIHFSGHGSTRG
jgi:hypothetical protein